MRAEEVVFDSIMANIKKCEEFSKIQDLLHSNYGKTYFLGIREDYFSIYYMGMSFAKVKVVTQRGGKYTCSYTINKRYLRGTSEEVKGKGYHTIAPNAFWDNLAMIRKNVEEHVLGYDDSGYIYLEKACQQWIINSNNMNPESDWYYVDMEYIYKEGREKSAHPFGRADLIAIKKEPENGKHKVAFIELKVGTDAYGITVKVSDDIKDKEKRREEIFKQLKNGFWKGEVIDVKLGSGLASHVVDFMQFFADHKAREQLRKEIIGILRIHKEFGLISEACSLNNLIKESAIEEIADIYIVTYNAVPDITMDMLSKNAKKRVIKSMKEMKLQFAKYFYKDVAETEGEKSSSHPIEELLNKDQIQGFIRLKPKFSKFINSNEKQLECLQNIKEQDYRFVFRFIDINNSRNTCAKCIE